MGDDQTDLRSYKALYSKREQQPKGDDVRTRLGEDGRVALIVALDKAIHKRLADWRASTSEAYFPLDSVPGPRVLVNYLLFGPGSVSEVLAARAAAPDGLRKAVEGLAAEIEQGVAGGLGGDRSVTLANIARRLRDIAARPAPGGS